MAEILATVGMVVSSATLLGVGTIIWKGGRWCGRMDTAMGDLCRRVERLERVWNANPRAEE